MNVPPILEKIAQATCGTKFEGKLWLVGGAVRDHLLGLPDSGDYDVVCEGNALEVAELLWLKKVSKIYPVVYPRFGTALVHVDDKEVELITARRESYTGDSRKPEVTPASLDEDALRRDLTINTLNLNLHTGELGDPTRLGLADLKAGILRMPGDPVAMVNDDPLRMMRIVRFRHRFNFEPVPKLYETVAEMAARLSIISAERIQEELTKMIVLPNAGSAIRDLRDLGLLQVFAPELVVMSGVTQGKWHSADVFEHTMKVVETIAPEPLLRFAALFHDVGKPPTRLIDEQGEIRFFGHESVGADMTRKILTRLKFSSEMVDAVTLLVRNHMRLGTAPTFTPSAARRLIRDLGGYDDELFQLVEADKNSLRAGVVTIDLRAIREQLDRARLQTPRHVLESPLSGGEIMKLLGLEPGPEVGKWKLALQEQVLEGALQPGDKGNAALWLKAAVAGKS